MTWPEVPTSTNSLSSASMRTLISRLMMSPSSHIARHHLLFARQATCSRITSESWSLVSMQEVIRLEGWNFGLTLPCGSSSSSARGIRPSVPKVMLADCGSGGIANEWPTIHRRLCSTHWAPWAAASRKPNSMLPDLTAPSCWHERAGWSGVIRVTKSRSTEESRAMKPSARVRRSRKMVSLEWTTRRAMGESTATTVRSAGVMSSVSRTSHGQATTHRHAPVKGRMLRSMAATLCMPTSW